jgi:hypothetical protein
MEMDSNPRHSMEGFVSFVNNLDKMDNKSIPFDGFLFEIIKRQLAMEILISKSIFNQSSVSSIALLRSVVKELKYLSFCNQTCVAITRVRDFNDGTEYRDEISLLTIPTHKKWLVPQRGIVCNNPSLIFGFFSQLSSSNRSAWNGNPTLNG